jgi:hypothetical protein
MPAIRDVHQEAVRAHGALPQTPLTEVVWHMASSHLYLRAPPAPRADRALLRQSLAHAENVQAFAPRIAHFVHHLADEEHTQAADLAFLE